MRKPGINMTVGVLLLVVSFGIATPALWGAAQLVKADDVDEANGIGEVIPGQDVDITIIAENLRFDLTTITASAGVQVTFTQDNRDAGVLHNVSFYTDRSAATPIHVGELTTGPDIHSETFTAPSTPGEYFFRCDVHPDTMTGAFIVQ